MRAIRWWSPLCFALVTVLAAGCSQPNTIQSSPPPVGWPDGAPVCQPVAEDATSKPVGPEMATVTLKGSRTRLELPKDTSRTQATFVVRRRASNHVWITLGPPGKTLPRQGRLVIDYGGCPAPPMGESYAIYRWQPAASGTWAWMELSSASAGATELAADLEHLSDYSIGVSRR